MTGLNSPQVRAALSRAITLLVFASIPVVVDLATTMANETTGTLSLAFVVLGRVVEGYRDSIRAQNLDIQASDVGSNLIKQTRVTETYGTVANEIPTGPFGVNDIFREAEVRDEDDDDEENIVGGIPYDTENTARGGNI